MKAGYLGAPDFDAPFLSRAVLPVVFAWGQRFALFGAPPPSGGAPFGHFVARDRIGSPRTLKRVAEMTWRAWYNGGS
jgi:hypothetical protein